MICRYATGIMGQLSDTIHRLVAAERYLVGQHAVERLEQRGMLEWQIVAGLEDGEPLTERRDSSPHPSIEVLEILPDGTEVKAVWSYLPQLDVAKLVTVHFFDEGF
jgi:hypothetical protein